MKDRFFIIISAVLIALFVASILENIFSFSNKATSVTEPKTIEIITTLEKAGLTPHEAEYYKVIDE